MNATSEPRYWYEVPHSPAVGTVLGCLEDLTDGQATLHTVEDTQLPALDQPFRVLLLRSGNDVNVYVNRCAHFGVPLAARQDLLIFNPHSTITCNVHYACYRWSDGLCISGDCAGEHLLPVPIKVDAQGRICIVAAEPEGRTV
jgi:nitrite reductase/ring-hydroxylating ferredoxin subunit